MPGSPLPTKWKFHWSGAKNSFSHGGVDDFEAAPIEVTLVVRPCVEEEALLALLFRLRFLGR